MGNNTSSEEAGGLMNAVIRKGGDLVFSSIPNPREPSPGSDEVVVEIRAAAINPADYKIPVALGGRRVGFDLAGVVTAVAPDSSSGLRVGDQVYGTSPGALSQHLLVPQGSRLALKPEGLSFAEAAAMPTAYVTALQALRIHTVDGGRIVVIGASGGCGSAGVQLAKALGFSDIVGVCSGRNAEFVMQQGATRVLDYTKQSLQEAFEGCEESQRADMVYDTASSSGGGEDYKSQAALVLKPQGEYATLNGGALDWIRRLTVGMPARQHLVLTDMNRADLETIKDLVEQRKLHPVIFRSFPFTAESVAEAYELLKSRRVVGKIVFEMD